MLYIVQVAPTIQSRCFDFSIIIVNCYFIPNWQEEDEVFHSRSNEHQNCYALQRFAFDANLCVQHLLNDLTSVLFDFYCIFCCVFLFFVAIDSIRSNYGNEMNKNSACSAEAAAKKERNETKTIEALDRVLRHHFHKIWLFTNKPNVRPSRTYIFLFLLSRLKCVVFVLHISKK